MCMKTIIATIAFIVSSFTFFSQPKYYNNSSYQLYVLDSLSIPYIPMGVRVSGEYSESFKEKFINFFGTDFQFIPEYSINSLPYKMFIANKKFTSEKDKMFIGIGSNNEYIVGHSQIPIKSDIYKSIWIIEIHCTSNNQYYPDVFFEKKDGTFEKIWQNLSYPASGSFLKKKRNLYYKVFN